MNAHRSRVFKARHGSRGNACADEAEDLALVDFEGCFVDGDGAAVGLADGGDLDDGGMGWLMWRV